MCILLQIDLILVYEIKAAAFERIDHNYWMTSFTLQKSLDTTVNMEQIMDSSGSSAHVGTVEEVVCAYSVGVYLCGHEGMWVCVACISSIEHRLKFYVYSGFHVSVNYFREKIHFSVWNYPLSSHELSPLSGV